jgi:hypothetical protein
LGGRDQWLTVLTLAFDLMKMSRCFVRRLRQIDAKLKPVLRQKEFRDFVLDRAIALVVDMAVRVT